MLQTNLGLPRLFNVHQTPRVASGVLRFACMINAQAEAVNLARELRAHNAVTIPSYHTGGNPTCVLAAFRHALLHLSPYMTLEGDGADVAEKYASASRFV